MPKDQSITSSRGRRLRRQRLKKSKQQQPQNQPHSQQSRDSPLSPDLEKQLSADDGTVTAAESSDSSSQKTVILMRTDSVDTEASLETDPLPEDDPCSVEKKEELEQNVDRNEIECSPSEHKLEQTKLCNSLKRNPSNENISNSESLTNNSIESDYYKNEIKNEEIHDITHNTKCEINISEKVHDKNRIKTSMNEMDEIINENSCTNTNWKSDNVIQNKEENGNDEIVTKEQRCLDETIKIQHFTEQTAVINEPQEWESVQELPLIQRQAAAFDEEKRERAEKTKTEDAYYDDSNLSLEDQDLLEDTSMPAKEEEDLRRFLETLNLNEHSRSRKRNSSETIYSPFPQRHLDVIQEEGCEPDSGKQEPDKVKTKLIDDKERGWKDIIYIEKTGQFIELDENGSQIIVDLPESGDELEAATPERCMLTKRQSDVEIVFLEDEDSISGGSLTGIDADVSDESTLEPLSERTDACTPGKLDEIFDEILENDDAHVEKLELKSVSKENVTILDKKIISQEFSSENYKIQNKNVITISDINSNSNTKINEELKERLQNKKVEEKNEINIENENEIDESSTLSVQVLKDHFTSLAQSNRSTVITKNKRNDIEFKSINGKSNDTSEMKVNGIPKANQIETHESTKKSESKQKLCKANENTLDREIKIEMNNSHEHTIELLRQLLISPHPPAPETSLCSLLSQLTVGQFANFSPTMRQQINALLEMTDTNIPDHFSVEAENILENLTPHHSRHASSSSDAASHTTAVYNSDLESRLAIKRPKTLRKLAVDVVLALPLGEFYLKQIGISISRPSSFCDSTGSKEKEERDLREEIVPNESQVSKDHELRKEEIFKKKSDSPIQFIDEDSPEMKNLQSYNECHPIESDGTRPQSVASTVDSYGVEWTPVPTEDPHVAVYLSPSQRNTCRPTPELADSLLDLHLKFADRRGYHEGCGQNSLERDFDSLKRKVESRVNGGSSASERLLAIIRSTTEGVRCSSVPLDHCEESPTLINHKEEDRRSSWSMDKSSNPRLQANHLADWLKLARGGNSSIKVPYVKSSPLPPKPEKNAAKNEIKNRKETQSLIETLAQNFEKSPQQVIKDSSIIKTTSSSATEITTTLTPSLSNTTLTQTTPVTDGEVFRQQMYNEYMDKVAEIADRRRRKVIKLSLSQEQNSSGPSTPVGLEAEFFWKLRERMDKLGIPDDDSEGENDNCKQLPKHLEEILAAAATQDVDDDGEFIYVDWF